MMKEMKLELLHLSMLHAPLMQMNNFKVACTNVIFEDWFICLYAKFVMCNSKQKDNFFPLGMV